jgi:glucose/mannose transport system permease protein
MRKVKHWGPGLVLISPSIILIAVFVYGLIGRTAMASLTNRYTAAPATESVGLKNYSDLFTNDISDRFTHSLRNLAVFTVVFIVGTMLIGLLWAFLFDRGVRGESVFRAIYLFPMAISFVASGVVWRWLLNSKTGPDAGGLNWIFGKLGLDSMQSSWWTNPKWGMASMAMPAIWQLSGYVMALYLAGFRGIPRELREAAAMDGATTYRLYRHVLFPQLTPVTLSALIIVGHMSMKMFDLIMSVSGPQWLTEVPAVYVWQTLLTSNYAKASAISILLLLFVAVLIVPYLVSTLRAERERA